MAVVVPTKITQIDDKFGNHYEIFEVKHVTGTVTDVIVDDSAVSACELPPDLTADVGLAKETSTSAGVTIRNQTSGTTGLGFTMAADDGVKQVTIASNAASGTYKIVVLHVGSAGGHGGAKGANL